MVQAIISDLDGTLYPKSSTIFREIDAYTYDFLIQTCGLSMEQILKLEKEHPNILDALSFLKVERSLFYNTVYKKINYSTISYSLLLKKEISQLQIPFFIVSLSPKKHIEKVLDRLKLLPFVSAFWGGDMVFQTDKKTTYISILKEYTLDPSKVIVLGDNLELDLNPAQDLGCSTFKICEQEELLNIFQLIRRKS